MLISLGNKRVNKQWEIDNSIHALHLCWYSTSEIVPKYTFFSCKSWPYASNGSMR